MGESDEDVFCEFVLVFEDEVEDEPIIRCEDEFGVEIVLGLELIAVESDAEVKDG